MKFFRKPKFEVGMKLFGRPLSEYNAYIIFDHLFDKSPTQLLSHITYFQMFIQQYLDIKKKSEEVDYGCDFKNGMCITQRDLPQIVTSEKCCCDSCAFTEGYLDRGQNVLLTSHFSTYEELFDKQNGFWRKGKGCILPRTLRSHICIEHTCDIDEENKKLLYYILGNMTELRVRFVEYIRKLPYRESNQLIGGGKNY